MKLSKLAIVFFVACANTNAAEHFNCSGNGWEYWNSDPEFRFLAGDFNSTFKNNIMSAANEFNAIGNVARNIEFGADVSAVNTSSGNGISEIYRDDLRPGVHGRSFKWLNTSCQGGSSIVTEAEILFDTTEPFTASIYDENQKKTQSQKNVAMHELGHAMGLAHSPNVLSVMKNTFGHGGYLGINKQSYHSDDREGFRESYSDGTEDVNVAGSTWWIKPGKGNIDSKTFNLMTETSGFELPNGAKNNAPTVISKGSPYRLPYHIENQSTTSQDVRATFYASVDPLIGNGGDINLGHVLYTMGRATEINGSSWFILPSSLQGSGKKYWFGYKVDKPYNSAPDTTGADDTVRYLRTHYVY